MQEIMNDGQGARKTTSGRHYVRHEGDKHIYYNLDREHIPLAKATCGKCGETIESQRCGDFVSCQCGGSFVDTNAWEPDRHRYGGSITAVDNK